MSQNIFLVKIVKLLCKIINALLGRSSLSIAGSALSLARSSQTERDNESCYFVRAFGVNRFIRRYYDNKFYLSRLYNFGCNLTISQRQTIL